MKQIRLLPIVIAAGAGLLLLKSIGIMTGGGYVLTGPAFAAGEGNATMSMPVEPTLVDKSPTIDDGAPTLPVAEAAASHAEVETSEPDGDAAEEAPTDVAAAEAEPIPSLDGAPVPGPEGGTEVAAAACPKEEQSVIFGSPDGGCLPPVDEQGIAVPMERGDVGKPVPLQTGDATVGSEAEVLESLAERRAELDAREAELDMRLALIEAAELRIKERTAALEVLEARIDAMVDEKRVLEEAHFTALVAMYETMKPKDAAAIFDELEPSVLLRVARAMNPRKMGPIMAKMNPVKAKDLTAGLAVDQVEPTIDLAGDDLSSLPQIVGQ